MRSGKCTSLAVSITRSQGVPAIVYFIVLEPLAVHPEGEGTQAARIGKVFRHPGSVRAERFGKILDQRSKKAVPCFSGGSLENRAASDVGFEILQRLGSIGWGSGHGNKV
jgi:hypothetical protein